MKSFVLRRPTLGAAAYSLAGLLILAVGTATHANVVLALLFTDNAVLQRDKPVPVWGTAVAGEKVVVAFAGQTVATTADAAGQWRVTPAPLPANATPANLVVTGNNTVTLTNLVVGEVWLASGQSNMEMPLCGTYD